MSTLEKEIQELKKKHMQLELDAHNERLHIKLEELKKLEGTVDVRICKTSKTTRYVILTHHISYTIVTDSCRSENKKDYQQIGKTIRTIEINEFPNKPYKRFKIETNEITPESYNGIIDIDEVPNSHLWSTYKSVSIDVFNNIWNLDKTMVKQILDGILDIKDAKWLMNGSDADFEFREEDLQLEDKIILDIPYVLLTQEESWMLNNKFTRVFLNKNVYLISKNSLKALEDWYNDEVRGDNWAYSACASVGERWRGSRIDEYRQLINKINRKKSK